MDIVVLSSYNDCHKLYGTVKNLLASVDADRIVVIGCSQIYGELKDLWAHNVVFMDENDILPISDVREYYRTLVPSGGNSPNWYYQQFFGMILTFENT